jgi:acyl-homoserine lactone acylase PvdQ
MFGSGPVRRYVGRPGHQPGSIDAVTALPGGESGDVSSPFYFNLLPLWLTNDAYPVVQSFGDVQRDALVRTVFRP